MASLCPPPAVSHTTRRTRPQLHSPQPLVAPILVRSSHFHFSPLPVPPFRRNAVCSVLKHPVASLCRTPKPPPNNPEPAAPAPFALTNPFGPAHAGSEGTPEDPDESRNLGKAP